MKVFSGTQMWMSRGHESIVVGEAAYLIAQPRASASTALALAERAMVGRNPAYRARIGTAPP